MQATLDNIQFVCEDLDHPEGIACGISGDIYTGGEAGQIYRIDVAKKIPQCIAQTSGFILGVTLDAQDRVYACDVGRREILRCLPDGQVTVYAQGTTEQPLINPNFSVFDAEGRLFFSDSGDYWQKNGSLWVVEPNAPAKALNLQQLPFANGLCLDSEEGHLYVVLSTAQQIIRYRLEGNKLIGQPNIIATLPKGVVPDGIALDSSRNIWLGCYKPDEIWKISPNGVIDRIMQDPTGELLNRPTNLTLRKNQVLFANLGGWHIGSFETEVEPLPLHYPHF
ncbi:MAG: SMP-30/gluconolactonase/LRE family protein [Verrucomicrobiales bacterium]|nr:SMP-30/gluconolactonase/LRE family protein [Verrucomicrobiales bacterium]